MEGTVEIKQVAKTYITKERKGLFKSETRNVDALKGISFSVEKGEIFGLLGPNGAGKTTLIKIMTTLLLPTKGTALMNGFDINTHDNQVRASVGCMLMGERGLYWKLTGRENLEYFGALYHLTPQARKDRGQYLIDLLGLGDIADRSVETYSSGQKMKLAFAKALVNDAPLLILDEPTNTLDLPSASELRSIVRQLNDEGKTIIYTTHIMAEAETLCDRVAIIDYGELLALGSVPELKAELKSDQITSFEGVIPSEIVDILEKLDFVKQAVRQTGDEGVTQLNVATNNGRNTLPKLIETLTDAGAIIQKIVPKESTLEDVFVAKTGRTLAEDTSVNMAPSGD